MKINRHFFKRLAIASSIGVVVLLIAIEIIGRLLGLTNPPLSVADDQMEYRFAPNQDCRVLGKRFIVNSFSQRSPEPLAISRGDLRVLVIGDSVPSGGTQVDQSDLATTRLQELLQKQTGRRTEVLNASAGSWGPPNELAYVNKFGDFDADVAIVILSTQDADDHMTFVPTVGINSSYPDKRPLSVTWMLIDRYIPRFFAIMAAQAPATPTTQIVEQSVMDAIAQLINRLQSNGRPVLVVMHTQRDELSIDTDSPAWSAIKSTAESAGATFIDTRPAYRHAAGKGTVLYRDSIHPTADGQHVLGDVLLKAVLSKMPTQ